MEGREYSNILQKIVDTLQTEYKKNSVEKECILLSLITRLEIITEKEDTVHKINDRIRHIDITKRLIEVILRSTDKQRINTLLSIISSPF